MHANVEFFVSTVRNRRLSVVCSRFQIPRVHIANIKHRRSTITYKYVRYEVLGS